MNDRERKDRQPGLQIAYDAQAADRDREPDGSVAPRDQEDGEGDRAISAGVSPSRPAGVGAAIVVGIGFFLSLAWLVIWIVSLRAGWDWTHWLTMPLTDLGITLTGFLAPMAMLWVLISLGLRDRPDPRVIAELTRRVAALPDRDTWSDDRVRTIGESLRLQAVQLQSASEEASRRARKLAGESEMAMEKVAKLGDSFDSHRNRVQEGAAEILNQLARMDGVLGQKAAEFRKSAEVLADKELESTESLVARLTELSDGAKRTIEGMAGMDARAQAVFERVEQHLTSFDRISDRLTNDRLALNQIVERVETATGDAGSGLAALVDALNEKAKALDESIRNGSGGLNGLMGELRHTGDQLREQVDRWRDQLEERNRFLTGLVEQVGQSSDTTRRDLSEMGAAIRDQVERMEHAADAARHTRGEFDRLAESGRAAHEDMDRILARYNVRVDEVGESVRKTTHMLVMMSEALARHGDGLETAGSRLDDRTAETVAKLGQVMGALKSATSIAQSRIDQLASGTDQMVRDIEQATGQIGLPISPKASSIDDGAREAAGSPSGTDSWGDRTGGDGGRLQGLREEIAQAAQILARLQSERDRLRHPSNDKNGDDAV